MHHTLKIEERYLHRILNNEKTFEIRKNDRDFQVGDTISFARISQVKIDMLIPIPKDCCYRIIYIHQGYGMNDEFVVLGITPFNRMLI